MMPDRNGWDVLEELRSDSVTRDIPVVITSAVYDRPGLHALPSGGAVRFAGKPFDIADLGPNGRGTYLGIVSRTDIRLSVFRKPDPTAFFEIVGRRTTTKNPHASMKMSPRS